MIRVGAREANWHEGALGKKHRKHLPKLLLSPRLTTDDRSLLDSFPLLIIITAPFSYPCYPTATYLPFQTMVSRTTVLALAVLALAGTATASRDLLGKSKGGAGEAGEAAAVAPVKVKAAKPQKAPKMKPVAVAGEAGEAAIKSKVR